MSIRSDAAWNVFGSGVPLLLAVITIPWLLKILGVEGFGILSLMWALVGYFGLFDLGVGRALTYELSKLKTKTNLAIGGILKSGIVLTILMGIVGSALVYFLLAPMAYQLFHVKVINEKSVDLVFKIIAVAIIPSTITSAIRGALEGLDGFKQSNLIKLTSGIVTFGAPPLFILIQNEGLLSAAIGLVVGRIVLCIYSIYTVKKYLIETTINTLANAKKLLSYGVWVTVSGLISPIMVYGDRFFVTAAIGASLLPFYAVPQEGMQRLLILPAALAGALLPRLVALNNVNEIFLAYKRQMKNVAISMALVCIASVFVVPFALVYWISPEFSEKTKLVVLCLSVGIWFNSIAQIPYALLNARGFPNVVAINHLFELFLYVFLVYFLATKYGVVGAAAAWGLRAALDAFLLHYWALKLVVGTSK